MRKQLIAVGIEHVDRELDIACAIRSLIARVSSRCLVDIVPLSAKNSDYFLTHTPDLVIMPFCYAQDKYYAPIVERIGACTFFNLAYEQLFSSLTSIMKAPRDDFSRREVIHLAWGESFKNFLEQNGVPRSNILICGNPSYALYKRPFSDYFPSKAELASRHGLDARKNWAFFPENYGVAFLNDTRLESYIKSGKYTLRDGWAFRSFARESLRQVMQWIDSIDYSKWEVIVRPRPATPLHEFSNLLQIDASLKRYRLSKAETVREWILSSDVVFSSYSTSLIEAAVAGKRIFTVAPIDFPPYVRTYWQESFTFFARGLEDFQEALAQPGVSDSSALADWANSTIMGNQANPLARVAEILLAHANERICSGLRASRADGALARMTSLARLAKRRLQARISGLPPVDRNHEKDYFTGKDIAKRVNRWQAVLQDKKQIAGSGSFQENRA